MEANSLNNYFDHIFIISRCINFDRRKYMDKQLQILGVHNYSYWYVPDYDFENSLIFKKRDMQIGHQRCTFGHYSLWKTCYELKYNHILVLEDDTEFIKNIDIYNKLLEEFNHKKSQSDIYLFDYLFEIYDNFKFYLLSDNYYVNQNGLEYLIRKHEKYYMPSDQYFFQQLNSTKYISFSYINSWYGKNDEIIDTTVILDEKDLAIRLNVSSQFLSIQPDKPYDFINKELYINNEHNSTQI